MKTKVRKTKARTRRILRERISFTGKLLLGLFFCSPLIICLLFSFQPNSEVSTAPLKLITTDPTLENYAEVFLHTEMGHYLLNTLFMCVVCIFFHLLFASFCAYAFVFFDFKLKSFFFTLIQVHMMIPGEVVIIQNYVTIQNWNLVDTYLALVITGLVSAGSIFMMRQYYRTLPKELKEAATLDGCSDAGFLFRIAMPLSVPIMCSLAIDGFIHTYNAYFWPLLITTTDKMRTVQIGMASLMGGDSMNYGVVLAGAVLCMLLPVLAFVIGQDYLIKGMTAGAVKS